MNILRVTKDKLKYTNKMLESFEDIKERRFKEFTFAEREHFTSEWKSLKKNKEYFGKILEVLE